MTHSSQKAANVSDIAGDRPLLVRLRDWERASESDEGAVLFALLLRSCLDPSAGFPSLALPGMGRVGGYSVVAGKQNWAVILRSSSAMLTYGERLFGMALPQSIENPPGNLSCCPGLWFRETI